ncbi:MAG: NADH-quinone oxidoreductase subunit L [Candidatus Bathyarchaeota archaeon]|nr:NADH-quinone oxidoreductase subunit L [Candidatus Bathyarchaeota archaeon]
MILHASLLAIILPIFSAILIYVFGKYTEKYVGWIATAMASLSVCMILSMVTDVVEKIPIRDTYVWIPSIELKLGFVVDTVSFSIALIVAVVSALSCFYSIKYMENKRGQTGYYASLLLFMAGMIGVILSANLIQFYLFWELMLIPSYFLIASWGVSKKRLTIGFKYFIFTHIGALFMLMGILSIYAFTGTFDLPQASAEIPPTSILTVFALLLIGFSVKMAIFPVHTWLPDAHSEAPTPISAMLSGVMIKCGAYAFARILLSGFGQTVTQTSDVLAILGVVTMIYGGLMALAQTDIKRLLAYSSISQMGYIFFGLGVYSTMGATGALFHVVNHAVCKSLLFMCAGAIIHQTGTRNIRRLGGLADKMPITCAASLIGALSLAGTPPLNGFWSEWMIFSGGISSGKILITTIAVVSTAITAGYYLWFIWRAFFGTTPKELENTKEASWLMCIPIIILAAIAVVVGIWPDIVLTVLSAPF